MPKDVPLEQTYEWEELGELIADRVKKTGFIAEKDWRGRLWTKFWRERKCVGLKFDWRLAVRCFTIWRDLRREKDHFAVIVGDEGDGKSTLETQMCAFISPGMDLKDICFDMQGYIKKLKEVAKDYRRNKLSKNDKSIGIDEGGLSLFSRESMSLSNRLLAKSFMVQRFLNVFVAICIPHYWSLDILIREHRIKTLIIITRRAKYKAIVGKGIKILNRLGKKDKDKPLKALPIPYGFFWDGAFHKSFPSTIDKKEYERYKFKHIKMFLEDASIEAATEKMINIKRVMKEFDISESNIKAEINKGEIDGRKIGNQWFITKKAYKKLMLT